MRLRRRCHTLRRAACVTVLPLALAACRRAPREDVPPQRASATATTAPVASTPPSLAPASDAGTPTLAQAKAIGNTSVVFKLTMSDGTKFAWKPRSQRGKDRFRGEVAATRLAAALGVRIVPTATFHELAYADLEVALAASPTGLALLKKEILPSDAGLVPGALIAWLEGLEERHLEREPERSRWRGWLLDDAPIAEGDAALAAQIAEMIVFDSVTGNWDRWSGGNVAYLPAEKALVLLDNDGAFLVKPPPPIALQRDLLAGLHVFPRRLVTRLRALDDTALSAVVGEERPGVPLLSGPQMKALAERRSSVLAAVDERVKRVGEAAALRLP